MATKYTLPNLPYDYNALEPVISAEIMQLHHQKHHNAYVTKLNEALEKYAEADAKKDISQTAEQLSAIRFNGGGHINHSIFWQNLAPKNKGGGTPPKGELSDAIDETWGSLDKFIEKFNSIAGPIQGSGWCWLAFCPLMKNPLMIQTCANQDALKATTGLIPLLGIDVWEHAYYLQYKNVRPDYLKAIWGVVNWEDVSRRFQECLKLSAATK